MCVFACPHCRATLKTTGDRKGQSARCPRCQRGLVIPEGGPLVPVEPLQQVWEADPVWVEVGPLREVPREKPAPVPAPVRAPLWPTYSPPIRGKSSALLIAFLSAACLGGVVLLAVVLSGSGDDGKPAATTQRQAVAARSNSLPVARVEVRPENQGATRDQAVPLPTKRKPDPLLELPPDAGLELPDLPNRPKFDFAEGVKEKERERKEKEEEREEAASVETKGRVRELMAPFTKAGPEQRVKILKSLGKIGEGAREATPLLCATMVNRLVSRETRQEAANALEKVDPMLWDLAVPIAISNSATEREAKLHKLARLGLDGKPLAPILLEFCRPEPRAPLVVLVLGTICADDPAMTDRLANWLLSEKSPGIQQACAQALGGMLNGKREVPELVRVLGRELPDGLIVDIMRTLGNFGPDAAKAMPLLTKALTSPSARVREAAMDTLRKIEPGR